MIYDMGYDMDMGYDLWSCHWGELELVNGVCEWGVMVIGENQNWLMLCVSGG